MGLFDFFKKETKVYGTDYKIKYVVRTSKYKSFIEHGTIESLELQKDKYFNNDWAVERVYDIDGSYNNDLTIKYTDETGYDDLFEVSRQFTTDHRLADIQEYNIDYLYHITHIDNLNSIIENGLMAHNNEYVKKRIDNENVNENRNRKEPIFGKSIHDYVPLYFNPKNPMLYVNKEIQENIVILAVTNRLWIDCLWDENEPIFTDGNAASNSTKFYCNLDDLNNLDWDCIKSDKWTNYNDGKRKIMAEVLIADHISSDYIEIIYCFNEKAKEKIDSLNDYIHSKVDRTMYFN